jgi:hypothetical protein
MQPPFRFAEQAALYDLWNRKRGPRRMPSRADLSTSDLRQWLGEIHLLEVVDNGRDFRYLVYGTEIGRYHDTEMTRRLVSEWPEGMRNAAMMTYSRVTREACPYLVRQNEHAQGRLHSNHRLVLPLSNDGATVSQILTHLHMIPVNDEDAGIFYNALPPGPAGAPANAQL